MNLTEDTDPTSADDRCDDFIVDFKPAHWIVGIPSGIVIAAVLIYGTYSLFH